MANVDETIRKISFNLLKLKEMFMFIKNRPTHGITSSLFVLGSLFVFFNFARFPLPEIRDKMAVAHAH